VRAWLLMLCACMHVESTAFTSQYACAGETYCDSIVSKYAMSYCTDTEADAAVAFVSMLEATRDGCTQFWVGEFKCTEASEPCKESYGETP